MKKKELEGAQVMKKNLLQVISLMMAMVLLCAMVGVASAENAQEKTVLTMGTEASFPPYEFYDGDKIVGIDVEVAEAIAKELGMTLEVIDMEFGAINTAVQTGKVDMGMAGMTVTEERLKSINFSNSYATGIQSVIVKEGSKIKSVDDLFVKGNNYVIGVQTATTGDIYSSDDFEAAGLATVERYKMGTDAVMALQVGKIDCVIIDNEPAKAYAKLNKGLVILDTEYVSEEYAISIAKDNDALLEKVNAALEKLKQDGTLQAIVAKYIPAETAE